MLNLTLDQLLAFALSGTVVSLLLEFVPWLSTWYNNLSDNVQRLVVLFSGLLVVLGAWGGVCFGLVSGLPWTCTSMGLFDALIAFLSYIFATQGTYLVTPKPKKNGK